jgi:hypothetical protein
LYRGFFHSGDWKEIMNREFKTADAKLDLPRYEAFWVRFHPLFIENKTKGSRAALLQEMDPSQRFFQKSYRIRTLIGRWHPDDARAATTQDRVERLYLWVWYLLDENPEMTADKLSMMVEMIGRDPGVSNLGPRSKALIRNALRWLSLLDPSFRSSGVVKDLLARTGDTDEQSGFLEAERFALEILDAAVSGKDSVVQEYLRSMEGNPIWTSDQIALADLVMGLISGGSRPERFGKVYDVVANRLHRTQHAEQSKIEIDLEKFTVSVPEEEKKIFSEALCLATDILARKGAVHVSEFVYHCFGFQKFDPILHQGRVFNLLSRVRGVLEDRVQVKFKRETIHAEGDWSEVTFVRPTGLLSEMRNHSNWVGFGGKVKTMRRLELPKWDDREAKELVSQMKAGVLYTRQELSDWLGGSRCTAIRRINDLVKNGRLERTGSARATRYQLVNQEKKLG